MLQVGLSPPRARPININAFRLSYQSGWSTASSFTTLASEPPRPSPQYVPHTRKIASTLLVDAKRLFRSTGTKLRGLRRNDYACLVAAVYTICVAAALIEYIAFVSPSSISHHEYGIECDNPDLMSTAESRFHINLPIAGHLSFTRAKLIDLAWDIGIGHGGRLLHAWIFYYVAGNTITWMLEYSALPYSVLLTTLFQAESIPSLLSLARSIRTIQGARAVLKVLFLIFAITHIFLFTTIWSAATGYQNVQVLSFPMPDSSWVTKDSPDLRLCWLPEVDRADLKGTMESVILGPRFGSVFNSLVDIDYGYIHPVNGEITSDEYQDVFAYARSLYNVRDFLDRFGFAIPGSFRRDRNISSVVWRNIDPNPLVEPPILGPIATYTTLNPSLQETDRKSPASGLPQVIKGWQYLASQRLAINQQTHLRNVTVYTDNSIWKPSERGIAPFARMEVVLSDFHLNESLKYKAGMVPYNSTLWYNGTNIKLEAPFLTFRSCPWWRTPLGECLCYKGNPLGEEFRIQGNEACTGRSEYIWGFSHFITTIGISLELVWCLICLYLWVSSVGGSNLAKYDRSALGTVRNILDLSEIIKEELGDNLNWQTEKQLWKTLKACPEVGYSTREKSPGVFHVKLVSFPGGRPLQRQP